MIIKIARVRDGHWRVFWKTVALKFNPLNANPTKWSYSNNSKYVYSSCGMGA